MPKLSIQRRFFQIDPAVRFSRTFHVSPTLWREVWKRYKFLDYTKDEAREYLSTKLKTKIAPWRFNRWVSRTEVYFKAQLASKCGKIEVEAEYFRPYHSFVLKELTKNK